MKLLDLLRMGLGSLIAHRLRSSLSALGIAVGITAVILLTSIGEGINRFVIAEFSQFGTNIIIRHQHHYGAPGKDPNAWCLSRHVCQ
jgi:putative ABC transport system permease protein